MTRKSNAPDLRGMHMGRVAKPRRCILATAARASPADGIADLAAQVLGVEAAQVVRWALKDDSIDKLILFRALDAILPAERPTPLPTAPIESQSDFVRAMQVIVAAASTVQLSASEARDWLAIADASFRLQAEVAHETTARRPAS
jgi:hypothetical protein